MSMLDELRGEVEKAGDSEKAKTLARFFKTGKGQYGEGDVFLGLTVPQSRIIATRYKGLPFSDIYKLLKSKFHEERLIALLILVHNFTRGNEGFRKEIFDFYLAHMRCVNNWDLVDLSADKIAGEFLCVIARNEAIQSATRLPRSYVARNDVLYKLAKSDSLWERRISIVSTYAFIKRGEYKDTFAIADILLNDNHDLIQKAVGWMLREVGKRVSEEKLESFLKTRYKTMPRTALRYAIEKFSDEKRKLYLASLI